MLLPHLIVAFITFYCLAAPAPSPEATAVSTGTTPLFLKKCHYFQLNVASLPRMFVIATS